MLRSRVLLAGLVLACVLPGDGYAQGLRGQETRITADQVSVERERDLYEAEGNVKVEQEGGRSLDADWMVVNTRTQIGIAVGNVVLRDGEDTIRADFAAIDLETLKAISLGADLDMPRGPAVTADVVARTGPNTYRIENGTFTTCHCDPSGRRPWQLDVGEADIGIGGYAVARNVVFRVLDVPALYTPWLLFPVKNERQSGFLVPTYAHSGSNGSEIRLPFFWAARDNINILLQPEYLSKRGFKLGAVTEYLFGEEGEGYGGLAFLPNDDEVDDDPLLAYSPDRWAYWLRHQHPLARGLTFGTDLNQASDNDYPVDFEDLAQETRNARYLDSSAWSTFGRSSWFASLAGLYSDDLQSPNNVDRDDFVLQRLPDVQLASLPRRLGPFPIGLGIDVRDIYFYQKADEKVLQGNLPVAGLFFDTGLDGQFDAKEPNAAGIFTGADNNLDNLGPTIPDGTENNGMFDEGELLADYGNRLDVYPRLTLPLGLGPVETFSELGYRGTFYAPENGSSETRSLWTGRADARMRFGKELVFRGRKLKHIVEPRVTFGYISDDSQAQNPLFVPESSVRQKRVIDGDIRALLRSPSDRIREEQLLQLAVANRFYGAPRPDGEAPRLRASLRLGGGYDFEESDASDLFIESLLRPSDNLSLFATWGYDVAEQVNDELDAGFRWHSEPRFELASSVSDRRHAFTVSYRYLRNVPQVFGNWLPQTGVFDDFEDGLDRINQISFAANLAVVRRLDLFADGFASFEGTSTSAGRAGFAFLSGCACWELVVALEQRIRPDETRFTVEVRLAGLGFEPLSERTGRIQDRAGAVDGARGVWESPAR